MGEQVPQRYDIDTLLTRADIKQTNAYVIRVLTFMEKWRSARGSRDRREKAIEATHDAIADAAAHLHERRLRIRIAEEMMRADADATARLRALDLELVASRQRMINNRVRSWDGKQDIFEWTCWNAAGRLWNTFRNEATQAAIRERYPQDIGERLHGGSASRFAESSSVPAKPKAKVTADES